MSALIAMNKDIELAIKEMCADAILQATSALSEKYGFDEEEAKEFLKIKDIKLVRTRGPAPKSEKKLKKSKGDKPKTKRGMSGYNLHNKIERPSVKAELEKSAEESDEKFKSTDVMTALAVRWKALSDDERSIWNEKAKLENESSSDEVSLDEEEETEVKEEEENNIIADARNQRICFAHHKIIELLMREENALARAAEMREENALARAAEMRAEKAKLRGTQKSTTKDSTDPSTWSKKKAEKIS